MKTNYDPGTKGEIENLGDGWCRVQSFRDREKSYSVDLNDRSCSCPHNQKRGALCKHITAAVNESARRAEEIALGLSLDELRRFALRPHRTEIQAVILKALAIAEMTR